MTDRLTDEAVKEGDYQTVCDVRMIRRWESGDVVWPQERYRMLLERVFGKPVPELGFVRRWTRTPLGWTLVASVASEPQAKDDVGDAVPSRKDFLDLSFGFAVLLDKPEGTWFQPEVEYSANGERPRRIGLRHVEQTEHMVEQINSLDQDQGGGALLPHALNGARAARVLLRQSEYSEEVGGRLERATGELIIEAGWVAFDFGRQQLARHLWTEAFVLGKVSGHDEIAAHVLSTMSHQANDLGCPKDAVKFAEAAQRHAGSWATPRVRAVFTLRQARGLASQGAGNLERFARNRSGSTIFYMRGLLLRREVEQACAVGSRALPVMSSLSSARIVNRLQKFCEDLRGYPSTQAAHEFLDTVAAHMTSKHH